MCGRSASTIRSVSWPRAHERGRTNSRGTPRLPPNGRTRGIKYSSAHPSGWDSEGCADYLARTETASRTDEGLDRRLSRDFKMRSSSPNSTGGKNALVVLAFMGSTLKRGTLAPRGRGVGKKAKDLFSAVHVTAKAFPSIVTSRHLGSPQQR